MNQKVMTRSLNVLGHSDVQIAKDGKQTMEALENGLPDLILMDIQMYVAREEEQGENREEKEERREGGREVAVQ